MAYSNAPESIKEIYKKILWALLIKMNVLVDEVKEMMGEIGGRGMGYLFEKERADMEKERADIEKERADTEKERSDAAELEIQRLKKELEKRMHVTGN